MSPPPPSPPSPLPPLNLFADNGDIVEFAEWIDEQDSTDGAAADQSQLGRSISSPENGGPGPRSLASGTLSKDEGPFTVTLVNNRRLRPPAATLTQARVACVCSLHELCLWYTWRGDVCRACALLI